MNQLIKAMDYHETSESLYTYLVNVARNAIIRSNGYKKTKKKAETTIITVRDIAPAQQGQETNALRIQQIVENSNLHTRKTMLDIDQ